MAEGMLGGVLGGEEEKPEIETPSAMANAEAFAAAVVAIASRQDPEVARKTAAFLDHQSHLLKIQANHLEDEHALRLEHLQQQSHLLRGQRLGQGLRIGFQLFLVLVATVIGIGFLLMIRDAISARGVVIEAFQVPPDLAQRGLTGQVIAKQVLDQLADFQARTVSVRPASSYRNNWGDDIKVEIPETGLSLGEFRRYMRSWLGHETHISGEVFRTEGGLTVVARTDDNVGSRFSGADAELGTLVEKAADAIYEQTQPYRHAVSMVGVMAPDYRPASTRLPEEKAAVESLTHDTDPQERSWAFVGLAAVALNVDHDPSAAEVDARLALAAVPGFPVARSDLAWAASFLGHNEEAVHIAAALLADRPSLEASVSAVRRPGLVAEIELHKSLSEGDYADAVQQAKAMQAMPLPVNRAVGELWLPLPMVLTHDLEAAAKAAAELAEANPDRWLVLGLAAFDRHDPSAVPLLAQAAARLDVFATPGTHAFMLRSIVPWLAVAKGRFGDLKAARELAATTPEDCYPCLRARGQLAVLATDKPEAERWFAEAIKQGPSLPQAWVDRGSARLQWGDTAGAQSDATKATHLSPHHADAWKLWGDVLAKQGHGKEALTKYDEALKYAPKWQQLQEAREAAANHKT